MLERDPVRSFKRGCSIKTISDLNYTILTDHQGCLFVMGMAPGESNESGLVGDQDVLIGKLSSLGEWLWVRQFGIPQKVTIGNCLRLDNAGNVYVSGVLTGALGGDPESTSEEMFVVKYDTHGDQQWIRRVGASGLKASRIGGINAESGNVYVCGEIKGAGAQALISKINESGILEWVRRVRVTGAAV